MHITDDINFDVIIDVVDKNRSAMTKDNGKRHTGVNLFPSERFMKKVAARLLTLSENDDASLLMSREGRRRHIAIQLADSLNANERDVAEALHDDKPQIGIKG